MAEPLPGPSRDDNSDKSDDEFDSAVVVRDVSEHAWLNQHCTDLTTIVPVKRTSLKFLDPYFGLLIKETALGLKSCVAEGHCLSIIESDFAALVLSGDKQIVRNGRVVNSFKVSSGNKNQIVLKTTDAQKRQINYLSHISKKYSSIKKVKQITQGKSSSQKAILKQSLLNFVVSNQWFAPRKPVLTLFEDPQNIDEDDNDLVKWMTLKSCTERNALPSMKTEPSVCTANSITTSGFRALVNSSLSQDLSNETWNVPLMLKTWSHDTTSNIIWKAAAVKSFGQKKLALQQACSAADDITMNDLAGYFDNLVHIPKDMSSMAEMMYQ